MSVHEEQHLTSHRNDVRHEMDPDRRVHDTEQTHVGRMVKMSQLKFELDRAA